MNAKLIINKSMAALEMGIFVLFIELSIYRNERMLTPHLPL